MDQIGPTVSDELQIAEIQLVEKGATVSREFISAPEDVIGRLSFSHICEIEWIDDPLVRYFYEQECMRCTWSVRELRRQIGTTDVVETCVAAGLPAPEYKQEQNH